MLSLDYLKQNGVNTDKAIELFGDVQVYNETFQDFLDGIDEKLANLALFKEQKDMPNYAIYAHSIKSDARYLGFEEVAKIALDHEMAGKENNESFVLSHYQELVDITNKMIEIANNYLNGEDNTPKEEKTTDINPTDIFNQMPQEKEDIILVADDSKLVTNFVTKSLQGKYKVVPAVDGNEVINIVKENKYHIISLLLDLNMPNVGGFEVLDYFNQNNLFKEIPVSIITGEDSKDMINKAFTYGIVDMLVKPFSDTDVKKVVEKTVNFLNN